LNETLTALCNAYLNNGTGSVIAYYSFDSGSVSSAGSSSNFTGIFKNESPSQFPNSFNINILGATGTSSTVAENLLKTKISNNSFDLSFSNGRYGNFSGTSFLRPDDYDSEFIYLFSFQKTKPQNGVLFGSLVKDSFDNGSISFEYGRGFNIGVNDRNQLFFQGSDAVVGDYILTANELELGDDNICSARISPYEVSFANYNLVDDEFSQQNLRTDCKIQNNAFTESFYIGSSPTYIRQGNTFSGLIDNLLIISGSHSSSDLKAISSGFVASGIRQSGSSFIDEVVTGHSIQLLFQSGVTGYQPVITGYLNVLSGYDQNLIEFTLSSTTGNFKKDGERFITGYSLPNNSGFYTEETSLLIPYSSYRPTGDDSFATLGLRDSGLFIEAYTISSTRSVLVKTGSFPLYDLKPITGVLLNATGYLKTTLTGSFYRTGDIIENLQFLDQYTGRFKKDYLYFLDKRL
jgi:hypothetical protein